MYKNFQLDLPLHYGKAPKWLFDRMVKLSKYISEAIIIEFGRDYFLKQLSDAYWFQSLGCALGFDWHSSGLTTTTCFALKKAFSELKGYGIFFCGGKGKASRKTPDEIRLFSEKLNLNPEDLIYTSKIVAKIDNNALCDGFNLYHHTFVFTEDKKWIVIQQGMSSNESWARRYHWSSFNLSSYVSSPHSDIVSDNFFTTLNLVDKDIGKTQNLITELSSREPAKNIKDFCLLKENTAKLPSRHRVFIEDINPKFLEKIFLKTYEKRPKDFQELIGLEGVGAKTLRALALISDLIYGAPLSFKDPAKYSFCHGGKDGHPYKIKLKDYDKTIGILERIVNKTKLERSEKISVLRRLYRFYNKY